MKKLNITSIQMDKSKMDDCGGEWWLAEIALKDGCITFVKGFKAEPTPAEVTRAYWSCPFNRFAEGV